MSVSSDFSSVGLRSQALTRALNGFVGWWGFCHWKFKKAHVNFSGFHLGSFNVRFDISGVVPRALMLSPTVPRRPGNHENFQVKLLRRNYRNYLRLGPVCFEDLRWFSTDADDILYGGAGNSILRWIQFMAWPEFRSIRRPRLFASTQKCRTIFCKKKTKNKKTPQHKACSVWYHMFHSSFTDSHKVLWLSS